MNAPGANSISVAELALALMLSLSRSIPAADASMKAGVWEKKKLTGGELRGKTLGIVGLGRIGQEVGARARAFGMSLVAHDPFISEQVAGDAGHPAAPLDDLCGAADYITLHLPVDAGDAAPVQRGATRQVQAGCPDREHRARRADRRSRAGRRDRGAARSPAPASTCSKTSHRPTGGSPSCRRSSRRRTSPRRRSRRRSRSGIETAVALRDFLQEGVIRNAVNFPGIRGEEFARVRPFILLAERMGTLVSQLAEGRTQSVGIRYYGPLVSSHADLIASAVVAGVLRPMLSSSVTVVNARAIAAERGIEVVESRSSRTRSFANMLSVKLQTTGGERWIEGTVFEGDSPRLTQLDGVDVEVPLVDGTLLVIRNDDRPGRHRRGRHDPRPSRHQYRQLRARPRARAARSGVVNLDQNGRSESADASAVEELRKAAAIKVVNLVTLGQGAA